MPKNVLLADSDFERHRDNIPPWPTDPDERAELLRVALECENGWRNTVGLRIHLQLTEAER